MAQFDIGIGGPQGSAIQPQQAVVDTSSAQLFESLSNIATGVGGVLAQGFAQVKAEEKKQAAANLRSGVMSGYSQKVTALNAAVDQGKISHADAQTRIRAEYNKTVAQFPALTEDITSFHKSLMGIEGLGDTLAQGTAVDQQEEDNKKKATAAGFITSGMTPDQQEQGYNSYMGQQKAIADMKYYQEQLTIQQKQASIRASNAAAANSMASRNEHIQNIQMKNNQRGVQTALSGFAVGAFDKANTDAQSILSNNVMTPDQKVAAIRNIGTQLNMSAQPVRGVAGADYVDSMLQPIHTMLKSAEDFASGKISSDTLKNSIESAQAAQMNPLMADPQFAKDMALSKILGSATPPAIQARMNEAVLRQHVQGSNPNSPPVNPTPMTKGEGKDVATAFDLAKHGINSVTGKTAADPKGTWAEVENIVNSNLKGVGIYSSSQQSPKQFNQVLDFMSSPEFLKYQKAGGRIDPDAVDGAKAAVSANYVDKLIPTLQQEWDKAKATTGYKTGGAGVGGVNPTTGMSIPTSTSIGSVDVLTDTVPQTLEYVWSGDSLRFKPNDKYAGNAQVTAKANELNKSLAPLINRTVRAYAHMDGSDNYSAYFKQFEGRIFGENTTPVIDSPNGR